MGNFMEEYFRTVLEKAKTIQTANEELTKATLIAIGYQRGVEEAKIECAKAHFAAISNSSITYDVVKDFEQLISLVS